jgi:oxalate decarboxylase/phosphoglucose isomerase-like protein (cupin superfamily)
LKYRLQASMLAAGKGSAPSNANATPRPVGVADAVGESERAVANARITEEPTMGAIDVARLATHSFDWGMIKWMVSPDQTPGAKITFGEVVLLPGQGHVRHNHPFSEEILYVLSGVGEQMLDDKPPFEVRSGDTIYVPTAIFHATCNTGWEPLRLLALYNPGGAERALVDLPDYRSTPSGEVLGLRRNQA